MKEKKWDERSKKLVFLAAVIAAGVLVYVLFGRGSDRRDEMVFSPNAGETGPQATPSRFVKGPSEEELLSAFHDTVPEEEFSLTERGENFSKYLLSRDGKDAVLICSLERKQVTSLTMEFPLPEFPTAPLSSPTPVEQSLYELHTAEFEEAVEDTILRFQELAEVYVDAWPSDVQPGNAANAFRTALREGESATVKEDRWSYALYRIRRNDTEIARITMEYIGVKNSEES